MRNTLFALAAAAALVIPSGCGSDGGGSTPQATFDAMKAAIKAKDMRKFTNCLTPESQKMMVSGLLMVSQMAKGFGGKSDPDMDALLKKHGVAEVNLKNLEEAAAKVKDKPGFMADFAAMAEKKGKQGGMLTSSQAEGVLKDVKITGETAKGKVVTTKDGKEITDTIEFRKVDGRWLIHMTPPTK